MVKEPEVTAMKADETEAEVKPESVVVKPIETGSGGETTEFNKTAKSEEKKPRPLSILLVFAAILVLLLLGYAVYRCKFAGNGKSSSKNAARENGEEEGGNKELLEK